ncbi:hypothetical protein HK102_012294, partial [Quaeritorhiza haematococci]
AVAVAKLDGPPVLLGQALDLGTDHRPQVVADGPAVAVGDLAKVDRGAFDPAPAVGPQPGAGGDPAGDAAEPGPHVLPAADRLAPGREQEERPLVGVLGVLPAAQPAAADPQDPRAVTADQVFEGRLVPTVQEAVQQLPIRKLGPVRPGRPRGVVRAADERSRHAKGLLNFASPPWGGGRRRAGGDAPRRRRAREEPGRPDRGGLRFGRSRRPE